MKQDRRKALLVAIALTMQKLINSLSDSNDKKN